MSELEAMSELAVDGSVVTNNQQVEDEDTDSLAEDEDQDAINDLGSEPVQNDSTGVEQAIILAPVTTLPVKKDDDDDFKPVKKRKIQESNENGEVDEVVLILIAT